MSISDIFTDKKFADVFKKYKEQTKVDDPYYKNIEKIPNIKI